MIRQLANKYFRSKKAIFKKTKFCYDRLTNLASFRTCYVLNKILYFFCKQCLLIVFLGGIELKWRNKNGTETEANILKFEAEKKSIWEIEKVSSYKM